MPTTWYNYGGTSLYYPPAGTNYSNMSSVRYFDLGDNTNVNNSSHTAAFSTLIVPYDCTLDKWTVSVQWQSAQTMPAGAATYVRGPNSTITVDGDSFKFGDNSFLSFVLYKNYNYYSDGSASLIGKIFIPAFKYNAVASSWSLRSAGASVTVDATVGGGTRNYLSSPTLSARDSLIVAVCRNYAAPFQPSDVTHQNVINYSFFVNPSNKNDVWARGEDDIYYSSTFSFVKT